MIVNARFLTQPITGVQRYGIEISRALRKLDPTIQFVAPRNIIHKAIADEIGIQVFGRLTGHLWEQLELPLYLKKIGNPILVNLANTAPLFYDNKVITVHDVAFERFPKTFSWKFRLFYKFLVPRILQHSKAVVTVSEFSKNELLEMYGVEQGKITVVYNSVSDFFLPKKSDSYEKYILAVSSLNYQKNFHSLVKAFNALSREDVKLYLIGSFNKNFADISLVEAINKNSNIELKGRVGDLELIDFYSNAICFVYPSLYEGFGIPPLEAQACGCPVVISNAASLPEVCCDSVLYCDPYDIEDIAAKIFMVLENDQLREDLRHKGFVNIKRFSWQRSAAQIHTIIKDLEK